MAVVGAYGKVFGVYYSEVSFWQAELIAINVVIFYLALSFRRLWALETQLFAVGLDLSLLERETIAKLRHRYPENLGFCIMLAVNLSATCGIPKLLPLRCNVNALESNLSSG